MTEKPEPPSRDENQSASSRPTDGSTPDRCDDVAQESFIERFWVADAPADLDEVEAEIDAEPTRPWERSARIAVLVYLIGFWAFVIWLLVR